MNVVCLSHTKLNLSLGDFKLIIPVIDFLMSGCLFIKLYEGILITMVAMAL